MSKKTLINNAVIFEKDGKFQVIIKNRQSRNTGTKVIENKKKKAKKYACRNKAKVD